jgi:ribulose-phosphate 3-epimerase
MKGEVQKCLDAGCAWLHVDVFDGVYIDSPSALTFGPQMVDGIRNRFANRPDLVLDVHLCVDRPRRYATPMAEAGATRLIFQWEAMGDGNNGDALSSAMAFARDVTSLKMGCGISINPDTDVATIFPLLDTGMIDLVDVLAVEPGFGGQQFNHVAIRKIELLRQYRDQILRPRGIHLNILVDGGINNVTSSAVIDAGADILVAGE